MNTVDLRIPMLNQVPRIEGVVWRLITGLLKAPPSPLERMGIIEFSRMMDFNQMPLGDLFYIEDFFRIFLERMFTIRDWE